MYFVGSVQPDWPNARKKGYGGTFLTRRRKLQLVRDWNVKYPALPLCIEHANADRKDFVVPPELVVGYVTGMFLDRRNNLCVTGYVFDERPEARMLVEGMLMKGQKWGLSAFTIFDYDEEDPLHVLDHTKQFTHVGITLNPAMAEEGSYIFEYSLNPDAISRIMRERELPAGAVANEASLRMWGVPPDTARAIVSVLDKNISELDASTETGIAPSPVDYSSSANMATNNNNGTSRSNIPNQTGNNNNNNNTNNAPKSPLAGNQPNGDDAMDIDGSSGNTTNNNNNNQGQSQQGQQSRPSDPVEEILLALKAAQQEIEKRESEQDRYEAMVHVLNGVNNALNVNKLALQSMPREFKAIYNTMENKVMAHDELITTELIKQGSAFNGNNSALVEKYRNEKTPLEERRAIAQYVQANKAARENASNSQKVFEEKLEQERAARDAEKRSYEEQLSRKRTLEEENSQLRAENERLTKRRTETEGLRSASGFSFLPSRPVLSSSNQSPPPQQQQQQQQQANAKPSGYSFYQAPPPPVSASEFAQSSFQQQYGNVPPSSSSSSSSNSIEAQRASMYPDEQQQSGFVSAAGFRLTSDEANSARLVPPDSWLNKFILPASRTGYGEGKMDPVFARTYQFLSNELSRMGNAGMAFTHPIRDEANGRETIASYDLMPHK